MKSYEYEQWNGMRWVGLFQHTSSKAEKALNWSFVSWDFVIMWDTQLSINRYLLVTSSWEYVVSIPLTCDKQLQNDQNILDEEIKSRQVNDKLCQLWNQFHVRGNKFSWLCDGVSGTHYQTPFPYPWEGNSLIVGVNNLHPYFCLIGVLKTVGVCILRPIKKY